MQVVTGGSPERSGGGHRSTIPSCSGFIDTENQPLQGATVTFTAQSGSVDPSSATTDADGIASTRWTLGSTAGQSTLTATAGSGVSTTVTATVTAASAATVSARGR